MDGAFVVQSVELGFEPGLGECCIALFVGLKDSRPLSVFDCHSINQVAVIVIQHKAVIVAAAGWDYETVCLVGEHLAIWFHFHCGGIAVVGPNVWGLTCRETVFQHIIVTV